MSGHNTSPLRAWAELLRLPALFTVPGDALAGAAALGTRPGRGTLLAIGSSLCLYEAGMALNDWADRTEDAVDRPHRPIPSGRIHPAAALTAATALTAAGVGLASRAGRTPGTLAGALAATVWAYDLGLKRTPAGPLAMGAARGLDVLLGATASAGGGGAARADVIAGREQRHTLRAALTSGASAVEGLRGDGDVRPVRPMSLRAALTRAAPAAAGLRGDEDVRPVRPTLLRAALTSGTSAVEGLRGDGDVRPVRPTLLRAALTSGASAVAGPRGDGDVRPVRPMSLRAALTSGASAVAGPRGDAEARYARTSLRSALAAAAAMAVHTTAVTTVSRNETTGGVPLAPVAALGATAALTTHLLQLPAGRGGAAPLGLPGPLAYAVTAARPLFHAALNPSPPLTQRAVGAGIRAMIPLQAALAARAGAPGTALVTAALVPLARRFSRKVSVT
ncbi:UbiA family prenyltransferase [Streptomyces sp. NPDC052012]|uniref:UbiA family prenyltransferase n=1 Tax=Streptomyces sp. NPDC052012 TaxID=3155051 RepID=UPI0034507E94